MKKLLTILSALTLTTTSAASVVSCGSNPEDKMPSAPQPPDPEHPNKKVYLTEIFDDYSINLNDVIDDSTDGIFKMLKAQYSDKNIDWNQLEITDYRSTSKTLRAKNDSKWYKGQISIYISYKKYNVSEVIKNKDIGIVKVIPGEYKFEFEERVLEAIGKLNKNFIPDEFMFIFTDQPRNGIEMTATIHVNNGSQKYVDDTNGDGIEITFKMEGLVDINQDLLVPEVKDNDPVKLDADDKERKKQVLDVLAQANPNLKIKYLDLLMVYNSGYSNLSNSFSYYYYDLGDEYPYVSIEVIE